MPCLRIGAHDGELESLPRIGIGILRCWPVSEIGFLGVGSKPTPSASVKFRKIPNRF